QNNKYGISDSERQPVQELSNGAEPCFSQDYIPNYQVHDSSKPAQAKSYEYDGSDSQVAASAPFTRNSATNFAGAKTVGNSWFFNLN
ncbi:MAG: hypothetical protein WAK24_14010, partial [Candidatus Acidiferrales bacterium]